MKKSPWVVALGMCAVTALAARGEPAAEVQAQTPGPDTISRKDYEALKRDHDELKKEFDEFKKDRAKAAAAPAAAPANNDAEFEQIDKTFREIKLQLKESRPGLDKFLLVGDGSVGYQSQRGTKSSFFAGISPLVLFQPTDRLLIEVGADINISNDATGASSTTVDLGIANASYIVNDNLVVGGGLFVAPFGVYHRHFDPPWINKLPDDPLVFSDGGLAPGSVVGVFASGAIPVKSMKILYDVYASNGPNVETMDPGTAGQLHFDNYADLNNNKAVGGRIALQPITALEFGYSFQYGRAGAAGFRDLNVLLQSVDFQYRKEFKEIFGTIDVNGQWVWSNVGRATYDPKGTMNFGPLTFNNDRNGGYILVAYRPTGVSNTIIRNLEFIVRYDRMQSSQKAPSGNTEHRWELGVDYWITPSVVLKTAYEFDNLKDSAGADAFIVQLGFGL